MNDLHKKIEDLEKQLQALKAELAKPKSEYGKLQKGDTVYFKTTDPYSDDDKEYLVIEDLGSFYVKPVSNLDSDYIDHNELHSVIMSTFVEHLFENGGKFESLYKELGNE